jgi:hypothetical protein
MSRLTIYEAWSVDVTKLPCGVVECTERKELDVLEFDGDEMHFTEALSDAGCAFLAALDWRGGNVAPGRSEYTAGRDWVTYVAVVEETAQAVGMEVAA